VTRIRLPGLIDPHVHTREPGSTHKEDWATATASALAGGYTAILAMPNTSPPVTDPLTLAQTRQAAHARSRCDFGLHLGAGAGNTTTASALADQVAGLKLYLDQTFGPLRLDQVAHVDSHFERWPHAHPLLCHAEGTSLAAVLALAWLHDRPVHICHVSRRVELELIRRVRERGLTVTCEVTPHHLFLTEADIPALGPGRSEVRPRLATVVDRDALWDGLRSGLVDAIATDHAPHTLAEKDGADPPPGFPGLETSLGLLLGAVRQGRLSQDRLVALMHANPARIFRLTPPPESWIEVDPDARWEAKTVHSRAGWTPFTGMILTGRVRRVVLRGQDAFRDGRVLAPPGSGRDLYPPKPWSGLSDPPACPTPP
jgi:carbamoyl-phosphate synthase/aspartate carbamoyltransferase/dihydroorotase